MSTEPTRTQVLESLIREHGPQGFSQLRGLTGWSAQRLNRGLGVAMGPQGPIRCEKDERGSRVFRLSLPGERSARRPKVGRKRGVKPGSTWSPARRAAQEGSSAVRGMQPGGSGPQGLLGVQPGLFHVWGALPVVHPAHAHRAGEQAGAPSLHAGDMGAVRAPGASAARNSQAGLGAVVA